MINKQQEMRKTKLSMRESIKKSEIERMQYQNYNQEWTARMMTRQENLKNYDRE